MKIWAETKCPLIHMLHGQKTQEEYKFLREGHLLEISEEKVGVLSFGGQWGSFMKTLGSKWIKHPFINILLLFIFILISSFQQSHVHKVQFCSPMPLRSNLCKEWLPFLLNHENLLLTCNKRVSMFLIMQLQDFSLYTSLWWWCWTKVSIRIYWDYFPSRKGDIVICMPESCQFHLMGWYSLHWHFSKFWPNFCDWILHAHNACII